MSTADESHEGCRIVERGLRDRLQEAERKLKRLEYHFIYDEERGGLCPTCCGPAHRDLSGIYWHTDDSVAQRQLENVRETLIGRTGTVDIDEIREALTEDGAS